MYLPGQSPKILGPACDAPPRAPPEKPIFMRKSALKSYAYHFRNSLSKLESVVNETISCQWLDASQEVSIEEYKEKQGN
jgi:hypothetical protein